MAPVARSDQLRVLLVQPSPVRGGAEESLLELVSRSQELSFTLACLADGPYVDDLEEAGATVVRLRAKRLRYPHMYAATVLRLARLAFEHDLVLGWQVKANYYGTPAARIAGRPAAWWDHGIRPAKGEPRFWIDNRLPAATRADLVLTSSTASSARHRRTRAILPGIPLERYGQVTRQEARRELGVNDSSIVLGWVGRLQPWKGAHLLIEAMPRILGAHPEAVAVFVGSDVGGFSEGYPAELKAQAGTLPEGSVRFLGQRDDVPALLPGFDRFVQTSLGEPFGLVTVEAMASGVPVIASAAGGTLEILKDGSTGRLFVSGDAEALADAVLGSLADKQQAVRMAEAASAKVREDFAIDRYVREIEEALLTLREGRS